MNVGGFLLRCNIKLRALRESLFLIEPQSVRLANRDPHGLMHRRCAGAASQSP
jgi:hypothetical protein